MRPTRLVAPALAILLVGPILAVGLLSLSRSTGLDFYAAGSDASLQWWAELFMDGSWAGALGGSIVVAGFSSMLAMLIAVPAVSLWRIGKRATLGTGMALASLAFFIPGVVAAVGLYVLAVFAGLFDTLAGLTLAHLSVTLPVSLLILRRQLGRARLETFQVARALGASPVHATATWLSADHRPSILAAGTAAFMASMSEATITLFLTDTRLITLPRRVVSGLSQDIEPTGFAAMLLWFALVFLIVFLRPVQQSSNSEVSP